VAGPRPAFSSVRVHRGVAAIAGCPSAGSADAVDKDEVATQRLVADRQCRGIFGRAIPGARPFEVGKLDHDVIMIVCLNRMTALLAPMASRTSHGVAAGSSPHTDPSTERQKSRKRNCRIAPKLLTRQST
jgi:hypothetical protein